MSRIFHHPTAVGFIVFCAALFGIFTRFDSSLAVLWPANALLVGLMARNPRWSTPIGWGMAALGFVAADVITGSRLLTSLLLTVANLMGVAVGFAMVSRFDPDSRRLAQPAAVLRVLAVAIAAGFAAGVGGGLAAPILFDSPIFSSGLFWMLAEVGNYLVVLPMVLTAPNPIDFLQDRRRRALRWPSVKQLAPAVALVLSCVISVFVGGPGALALPVPALLWSAISYRLFTITILTLGFSVWTLIALSEGFINTGVDLSVEAGHAALSARLGVLFITLAPLTVASVMAARTQLMERLQHLAAHDQLTGLLNRRAFRERADRELADLGAVQRASATLMLDLDRFKSINDTYGHAAGDKVLAGFAERASHCLRARDAFGRLGGEEFCVLLPGCTQAEAQMTAERIRSAFAREAITLDGGESVAVTVSIGLVFTEISNQSLDALLLVADKALYRAKQAGRDRVETAVA